MTSSGPDLRDLVASVVKEMVGDLVKDAVRDQMRPGAPAAPPTPTAPSNIGGESVTVREHRVRTEAVRITNDAELDQFARQLLALFENPKNRQDLRAGRLTFRLAKASSSATPTGPATRIERGAVTERQVKTAAECGHRIILGRRAVLTPLGREKARALNVHIEKER
ncbi:hypothetical protein BJ980_000051 [Nocardioides daedukensis]|uniref:Uncharacterized protein n=1 Tax=Nocardioides daedukensis TaxID=634462 RepID=A0A7Y9RZ19_9ACTN|nr:hypothetical protein [Nocardioides daedukensis]NYG57128.1 hypothetical protein [Nocardioides daedukensis]